MSSIETVPSPELAGDAALPAAPTSEADALLDALLSGPAVKSQQRLVTFTIDSFSADVASVTCFDGTQAMLPASEWYPQRPWRRGEKLTGMLVGSEPVCVSVVRDQQVALMLAGLVPEVRDGRVQVMGVARVPGVRCKVAVASADAEIDPVAACVGRKAGRVRMLGEQLGGERVDVISWSPDRRQLLIAALAPAQVDDVSFDGGKAEVRVPRHRMAATVGQGGLNAQLAGRLAGFTVQVVSG